jgi:hypothetical protein
MKNEAIVEIDGVNYHIFAQTEISIYVRSPGAEGLLWFVREDVSATYRCG